MGKQGETATNKDNNISKFIELHFCHISPNMACFCKLMAQNWHKNFALAHACSDFFLLSIPNKIVVMVSSLPAETRSLDSDIHLSFVLKNV